MSRKRGELQSRARIKRGFIQCDMVNPRKNSVTFNDNDAFLYSILDQLSVTKSRWIGKSYGDKLELGATTYGIFYLPETRPFSTLIELIGK